MKQVMVIVRLDTLVNLSYFEDQNNVRLYKGNIKGTQTLLYRQKKNYALSEPNLIFNFEENTTMRTEKGQPPEVAQNYRYKLFENYRSV